MKDALKLVVALAMTAATAYWAMGYREGQFALRLYQEREVQERRAGSICLPMKSADGRSGWSSNLQYVLDQGKGTMYGSQGECEQGFQAATGSSPKR